ncbi:MAG: preprotein translocase subunit SecE [Microbacteriaceae bacterium]|nr:preprotein translocase subunit SecE [Actinomycetota bacterium]HOA86244.1 preprotein translocase subunit SecE [Microbacteriaceae bacterium]HPZ34070.1 preprotein translocase subunit SecE [Microbacteriaceae bacterium]HQC92891.1 preprotein translocase subunit SecE [Microbacteriaceae bacterium]
MSSDVYGEPGDDIVAASKTGRAKKPNIFARIALFIRQVFAELRKVITPTRQELVKFTLVVLAFVVIMMGIVYGLDLLFALVVNAVFGIPR